MWLLGRRTSTLKAQTNRAKEEQGSIVREEVYTKWLSFSIEAILDTATINTLEVNNKHESYPYSP